MSSPDPRAVEADDRLLDALAAGELTGPDLTDDPAIAALADWRAELRNGDQPAVAAPARPRRRRPARSPRRSLAAAAATAAVLVGGGVAAAAVSGPHGPLGGLHRLVFGAGDHAETPARVRCTSTPPTGPRTCSTGPPACCARRRGRYSRPTGTPSPSRSTGRTG